VVVFPAPPFWFATAMVAAMFNNTYKWPNEQAIIRLFVQTFV
jgi:hypothetical protein